MKKVGVFGGTFNPIHKGHVHLAQQYKKLLSLDEVIVMPNFTPPHKQAHDLISGEARLDMCRLAFEGQAGFIISDLEQRLGGNSYTVNTLERLKSDYPDAAFYLLIGSDMFLKFDSWRRFEDILKLSVVCTAPRHSHEMQALKDYQSRIDKGGTRTIITDIPVMEMSSTDIRTRLRNGEDVQSYLPDKVIRYIAENKLYETV